jgi:hypothetical protein
MATEAKGTGIAMYLLAHDNLISNCVVYNNALGNWPRGTAYLNGTTWGAGVIFSLGAVNNSIENSYVFWNHGEGLTLAGNGCSARNCVVADNWSVNLYFCNARDCTAENNLIYLSSTAKTWPTVAPNRWNNSNLDGLAICWETYNDQQGEAPNGLIIRNNIIVNCYRGIDLFRNDIAYTVSGWLVENNTIINNDYAGIQLGNVTVSSSAFTNNAIVQRSNGYLFAIAIPGSGLVFSNNLYDATRASPFRLASTDYDVLDWSSVSGDTDSLFGELQPEALPPAPPRLWDSVSLPPPPSPLPSISSLCSRYRFTQDSIAIDAGIPGTGFSADRDGNSRPQGGGWDIGAFEFIVATDAPAPPTRLRFEGI